MSDLFLDTDVRIWYPHIAKALAESPYPIDELTGIFKREVAPITGSNLLVVAGEWAGFDEEWLVSRITARLTRTTRMPFFKNPAHKDWEAVTILIAALRALAPSDWPRRIKLWDELSKIFLDRDTHPKTLHGGWTRAELESVWRDEVWPSYGRSVKLYRKYNGKSYPTEEEIEHAFTAWKNAVS